MIVQRLESVDSAARNAPFAKQENSIFSIGWLLGSRAMRSDRVAPNPFRYCSETTTGTSRTHAASRQNADLPLHLWPIRDGRRQPLLDINDQ